MAWDLFANKEETNIHNIMTSDMISEPCPPGADCAGHVSPTAPAQALYPLHTTAPAGLVTPPRLPKDAIMQSFPIAPIFFLGIPSRLAA